MIGSFKLYHMTNRITGEEETIGADSSQEACEKLGWPIGDCCLCVLLDPDNLLPPDHPYQEQGKLERLWGE